MKKVSSLSILLVIYLQLLYTCAEHINKNYNRHYIENTPIKRVDFKNIFDGKSVEKLQSVCKVLCGEGLGGPLCGAPCGQQTIQSNSKTNNLIKENNNFCPILCSNGLGIPKCKCSIKSIKNNAHDFDLDGICLILCKNNIIIEACNCSIKNPIAEYDKDKIYDNTITTTPNWNDLCEQLCKIGEGGSLCNCDLPPFIKK